MDAIFFAQKKSFLGKEVILLFKRQSMAENVEYLRSINVRAILSFGPPQAAEKSGFGDSRITIYSGKTQYVIRAAVGGQKIGFSTLKL